MFFDTKVGSAVAAQPPRTPSMQPMNQQLLTVRSWRLAHTAATAGILKVIPEITTFADLSLVTPNKKLPLPVIADCPCAL